MTSIRASSLDRILECSGSMTLCAVVDDRQGDEGLEGTALHQLAHARMVSELGASGDPGAPVECKSVNFSQWISNYYFRTVATEVPPDWSLEVEVPLAYEWPRFILSGHIDALALSPDCTEAIIFDLKTGYIAVDVADQNWQILAYIALLQRAYPGIRKVTAFIVQPRADEDMGEERVSSVTIEDVNVTAGLEAKINHALDNPMELNTGIKCCRWCEAASQCPAAIKLRDLMKHTLTKDELARIGREPNDAVLADWVIAGRVLTQPLLDAAKLAKERIETVEHLRSSDGHHITVKVENGAFTVENKEAFLSQFRTVLPTDESLAKCWKPSMSEIKAEIAEKMNIKKTSKVDSVTAETVFDAHFRPYVTQGVRKKFVIQ